MGKLSWREKYAGILVLLIGIVFLLMQVASLLSNTSHPYSIQNGSLIIDKNELYSDIRTYAIILAGILAGWLLLKSKRTGWVLSLPILLFIFAVLGIKTAEQVMKIKKFDNSLIGPGIGLLLLFLAILFLFLPSARQKYRVSKDVVLLTLSLFAALCGTYIFLQ
jgi:uncharacterized membrane protein YbjE (DUF340 family)